MTGRDERLKSVRDLGQTGEITELTEREKLKITERINQKTNKMKERFDKTRAKAKQVYKVDDLVVIEKTQLGGGKLAARYKGPFRITQVLENDRFALRKVNGQKRTAVAGYEQLRYWPGETAMAVE